MRSGLLTRFEEHAAKGARAIAVHDVHGRVSYADLWGRAHGIASALRESRPSLVGERVALLVEPGASFVAALYGVWLAGGCAVVLSPLHPPAESAYFCSDGEVRTILVSSGLLPQLGEAASGRIVSDVDELAATALKAGPSSSSGSFSRSTDDALQLYTSGTTGRPKGAVLSHENLSTQQSLVGEAWRFSEGDVLLHALPLHHMHGLAIALFTALGAGAETRMLSGFDAAKIWNELEHATVFMGVPTMYGRLCETFDKADLATQRRWRASARALRLATSGSAALPLPLASRWEAIAGIIPVERFGMTEIGVGLTNPIDGPRKKGAVGFPLPTVETRVVVAEPPSAGESRPEGDEPSAVGELWIRGPSVFRGYFRREGATRAAFVSADDGGAPWFKTGDTVTQDQDGAFRILGRTGVDILKSGGYKLSSLEIEAVILEMPSVREVAVVGIPDERWGERVVACVVAHEGSEPACSAEAVRAYVRTKLAPYKCPKDVHAMPALPRNAMGKVVKPELVALLVAKETPT